MHFKAGDTTTKITVDSCNESDILKLHIFFKFVFTEYKNVSLI